MFSPTLGIVLSFGIALIFKHVDFRDHPKLELPLYLLLMYIPFVLAECFHLSGIVTIFFSGLSARRYIAPNVSKETETNSEVIFKLVANLAETCIFLELGLSVFGLPQTFAWAFIGWAFLAALVGRAAGIYPLAFLYNFSLKEVTKTEQEDENKYPADLIRSVSSISSVESLSTIASALTNGSSPQRKTPPKRKDKQISLSFTHILWFAGLRGAVAYACARKFPDVYGHADEFTAATIVVVLVTIIFMGGATEHLLRLLGIKMNVDEEEYMKQWHKERRLTGRFHTLEYNYIYRFVVRDPPVIPETGRHHTKKQEFPEYSTDEAPTDEDTQRAFNYMAPEIADPPEVQKVIDVEKMSFELAQPLHVQGVPSASFDYQRDDTELPRVKGVDVPIP
jgi:NhaP-type Na+/H+ or K+/H+ antiporter